ncbi:MAG: hypothetical protein LBJ47_11570 [Tannerella sp.]|nr:hypothetical protein [Tannerella sp.]
MENYISRAGGFAHCISPSHSPSYSQAASRRPYEGASRSNPGAGENRTTACTWIASLRSQRTQSSAKSSGSTLLRNVREVKSDFMVTPA